MTVAIALLARVWDRRVVTAFTEPGARSAYRHQASACVTIRAGGVSWTFGIDGSGNAVWSAGIWLRGTRLGTLFIQLVPQYRNTGNGTIDWLTMHANRDQLVWTLWADVIVLSAALLAVVWIVVAVAVVGAVRILVAFTAFVRTSVAAPAWGIRLTLLHTESTRTKHIIIAELTFVTDVPAALAIPLLVRLKAARSDLPEGLVVLVAPNVTHTYVRLFTRPANTADTAISPLPAALFSWTDRVWIAITRGGCAALVV